MTAADFQRFIELFKAQVLAIVLTAHASYEIAVNQGVAVNADN